MQNNVRRAARQLQLSPARVERVGAARNSCPAFCETVVKDNESETDTSLPFPTWQKNPGQSLKIRVRVLFFPKHESKLAWERLLTLPFQL
jgi:hypothetical protein